MSDLSEASPASDPTFVPDTDDLERITKSRVKRKSKDVGSKTSKSKPTQITTQKITGQDSKSNIWQKTRSKEKTRKSHDKNREKGREITGTD